MELVESESSVLKLESECVFTSLYPTIDFGVPEIGFEACKIDVTLCPSLYSRVNVFSIERLTTSLLILFTKKYFLTKIVVNVRKNVTVF